MLDAEFRNDGDYKILSIAYTELEEQSLVGSTVDIILDKSEVEAETYITSIKNGKEVLVIKYNDSNNIESPIIFEEIIKELDITKILN